MAASSYSPDGKRISWKGSRMTPQQWLTMNKKGEPQIGEVVFKADMESHPFVHWPELVEELFYAIERVLSHREKMILFTKCGVRGFRRHTFEEIARMWNLHRERIRQIFAKACIRIYQHCEIRFGEELHHRMQR